MKVFMLTTKETPIQREIGSTIEGEQCSPSPPTKKERKTMEFIETPIQRENRTLRVIVFVLSTITTAWLGFTAAVLISGGC